MASAKQAGSRKKTNKKKTSPSQSGHEEKLIRFDYIKSNCFRVVRVDGAHGGVSAKGDGIQMALFSERRAIPKREEYVLLEDEGKVGDLKNVEIRDCTLIREVEVEAILPMSAARALHLWLGQKIKEAELIMRGGDDGGE